jgi:hypothetical protein
MLTYTGYQDVQNNGSSASHTTNVTPSYDAEVGIRVHKIYSITADYLYSPDGLRKSYSLGFKAHLPGFFLIGGSVNNISDRSSPQQIIQTTLGFEIAHTNVTDTGIAYKYNEAIGSAALEIHIKSVIAFGNAKLRSYIGNYVVGYGAGLGFEF